MHEFRDELQESFRFHIRQCYRTLEHDLFIPLMINPWYALLDCTWIPSRRRSIIASGLVICFSVLMMTVTLRSGMDRKPMHSGHELTSDGRGVNVI